MATVIVSELIYAAGRLCGLLTEGGRGLSASESADGLLCLNSLLDSWQAEQRLVYAEVGYNFTMVANQASYSVGLSGTPDISIQRPEKLERVGLRMIGTTTPVVEVPLRLYNRQEWAALTPKALTSTMPTGAYYEPTIPNGTLLPWPIPTQGWQWVLYLWQNLATQTDPTASINLPPGYQSAIEYNLALEMSARWPLRARVSQYTVQRALAAKRNVKVINDPMLLMQADAGSQGANPSVGLYDIFSNQYDRGGI